MSHRRAHGPVAAIIGETRARFPPLAHSSPATTAALRSASLRRSILPLVTVLAVCGLGVDAHAQSESGSIAVGAVILATAPGALSSPLRLQLGRDGTELSIRGEPTKAGTPATVFVRIRLPNSSPAERRFIGRSVATGVEVRMRLPDAARNADVHLEQLILAGT